MVNTDAAALVADTARILEYGSGSGSLSLYVAHGGTSFGFWAGACDPGEGLETAHIEVRRALGFAGGCACCSGGFM